MQSFMGEQSVACPNEINAVSVVCVCLCCECSCGSGKYGRAFCEVWVCNAVIIVLMCCSHDVFFCMSAGESKVLWDEHRGGVCLWPGCGAKMATSSAFSRWVQM